MTTLEFNKVVEDQLNRITNVLVKKAAEYNLDADRMSALSMQQLYLKKHQNRLYLVLC